MLTLVVLDRLLRPAEQLDNFRKIVDLLLSSIALKHLGLCAKLAVRRAHICPPLAYFNDQRREEDGKSLDQQLFERVIRRASDSELSATNLLNTEVKAYLA